MTHAQVLRLIVQLGLPILAIIVIAIVVLCVCLYNGRQSKIAQLMHKYATQEYSPQVENHPFALHTFMHFRPISNR